jgi:predicted ferric reductase
MKVGKKNLRYALIFLAIVVALYIFTQGPQLNVESFASSGTSWWVWVLVVLGIFIFLNFLSFLSMNAEGESLIYS